MVSLAPLAGVEPTSQRPQRYVLSVILQRYIWRIYICILRGFIFSTEQTSLPRFLEIKPRRHSRNRMVPRPRLERGTKDQDSFVLSDQTNGAYLATDLRLERRQDLTSLLAVFKTAALPIRLSPPYFILQHISKCNHQQFFFFRCKPIQCVCLLEPPILLLEHLNILQLVHLYFYHIELLYASECLLYHFL